jgi:microcystin-dependent protein
MNQFVGQILVTGFNFAPVGWALCNGQLLPISQNTALFSLLGTTYGGDGRSTFALPNLQGMMAIGAGNGPVFAPVLGQTGGETAVTLVVNTLPAHNHSQQGTASAVNTNSPANALFGGGGRAGQDTDYAATSPNLALMNPGAIQPAGGSQPHNNVQPSLVLNYIIALQGVYPSRP